MVCFKFQKAQIIILPVKSMSFAGLVESYTSMASLTPHPHYIFCVPPQNLLLIEHLVLIILEFFFEVTHTSTLYDNIC